MPAAVTVDETDWVSRARLKCPTASRHTDWFATREGFRCRSCDRTYRALVDDKTGQLVRRDEVEVLGGRR